MSARVVDAFLIRLRKRLGVEVIPPRGAFGAARAALASGDVVVMPIDQVPDRAGHGLDVRFLREAALADRAPATLAWRARATALVVAARRMADDRIRVSVLEVIPPVQSRQGMRARPWIDTTTKAATMALEAMVLRTPESWMWLHRRWKAPRSLRGMRQEPLVATDEAG